jgi:prephenate dehydrogenase
VRIAFLGLGLIGGSIARALREGSAEVAPDNRLVAWTPSGEGPRRAVAARAIDEVAVRPEDALDGADLVVLAAPALDVVELIGRLGRDGALAPHLAGSATVTDVASTKVAVLDAADRAGLRFVGGHPMAGRETSGFGAASPDLFEDRPWAVVPGAAARSEDVARVEWLAAACRARVVRATAPEHDQAVAAISALPLVASAALAEVVAGDEGWSRSLARRLAAGGWTSATRLARGDPTMGASLLGTNARATAAGLRRLRDALDRWLTLLESDATDAGGEAIRERLAHARAALDEDAG